MHPPPSFCLYPLSLFRRVQRHQGLSRERSLLFQLQKGPVSLHLPQAVIMKELIQLAAGAGGPAQLPLKRNPQLVSLLNL